MPVASAWAGPALPFQDALLESGLLGIYALLALASFLKYTAPFLPGDAALLVGVFFVGARHGSWGAAAAAIVVGGTSGAMVAYLWGRRFGALLERPKRLAPAVAKVRALLGRWGLWALVVNRFLPGARSLFLPVAGVLKMPAADVAAAVAVGNTLFAALLVGLGYWAGREYARLASLYHLYLAWFATAAVLLASGGVIYWLATRALAARRARAEGRAAAEAEAGT